MIEAWCEKWEVIREVGKAQDRFAEKLLGMIVGFEKDTGLRVSGVEISRGSWDIRIKVNYQPHIGTGSAYLTKGEPSKLGVVKYSGG